MHTLYQFYATVFGLLIGSFLNVVIYRLPREKEIVIARSACPKCSALIPWWYNLPVVSWLLLRGKCASCKAPISLRYPAVELMVGLLFGVSFPESLDTVSIFVWFYQAAISSALICHFFIDLEHKLLLDKINFYLLSLMLPYSVVFYSYKHWLIGGALGFLGPLGVSWAFYKIKGRVGLGGGDIKLWGVLGIFLGPFGVMENIFFSCLVGSIVGILLILLKKYDREGGIPFGPFIIFVALIQIYIPGLAQALGVSLYQ